jgi:hypothetical protein
MTWLKGNFGNHTRGFRSFLPFKAGGLVSVVHLFNWRSDAGNKPTYPPAQPNHCEGEVCVEGTMRCDVAAMFNDEASMCCDETTLLMFEAVTFCDAAVAEFQ